MPRPLAPTAKSSSRSSKSVEPAPTGLLAVGEVVGVHALSGLLRVRAYQPPAPSLAAGRRLVVERSGERCAMTVASAAPHGKGLVLVALDGVTDRDAAQALVGARLLVRADELPPPAPDEFYYHEVEGFLVETTEGVPLGAVGETFATGLNDVLVVRGGEREYLIPVIADVIRTIDRAGRRIVIEAIPGLLE